MGEKLTAQLLAVADKNTCSARTLIRRGLVEYRWEMPDGTLMTDTQLGGRFQGEYLPSRWAGHCLTEKGRRRLSNALRRNAGTPT